MRTIIMATENPGKIKEAQEILGKEYNVISIKEANIEIEIDENQKTFEGNAKKKAEEIAKIINSNKADGEKVLVLGDDSGIIIPILSGQKIEGLNENMPIEDFPGVYTKRWFKGTVKERNLAILDKLKEYKGEDRKIKVITALALSDGGKTICKIGELEGVVPERPRGENGFGFDEIIELKNRKTVAELSMDEKNKISARKIAFEKLKNSINI